MKTFKLKFSFLLPIFLVLFMVSSLNASEIGIDDAPPVIEGHSGSKTATFTFSGQNAKNETVDYIVVDGSATGADNDFVEQNGTITFSNNNPTATITVSINSDTNVEADENFFVELSNFSGDTITRDTGMAFIINDDFPSYVSIQDAPPVVEGDDNVTQTITFTIDSNGSSAGQTIEYRTVPLEASSLEGDFVATSGTLTFPSDGSSVTFDVTINGDSIVEVDEMFSTQIYNYSGTGIGKNSGLAQILNDDTLESTFTRSENLSKIGKLLGQGVFTKIGGEDISKVNISSDGKLTFITPPNYERPDDADLDHIYKVTVQLELDPVGVITQDIVISVTDLFGDLSIEKTASTKKVRYGSDFSYTLKVKNDGPDIAEEVNIVDELPSGMTYKGKIEGSGWTCDFNAGVMDCSYANNLGVGASTSPVQIKVAAPSFGTETTNIGYVYSNFSNDNNYNNDEASVTTELVTNATDLNISISAPANINKTDTIEYIYTVSNLGDNNVTGVQFTHVLDENLTFISLSMPSPAKWSCSTGSKIICDYTFGDDILEIGEDSDSITVLVRAPNATGTIDASVTVESYAEDTDLSNNTATVSTVIGSGTTEGGDVGFTKYLQYNVFGDLKMLTGANLNYTGPDPGQNYNDNVDMQNIIGGATSGSYNIFNSSTDRLDLNSTYKVVWAGLYWQGRSQTSNNGWDDSNYDDHADGKAHMNQVLLKTPNDTDYRLIVANNLNSIDRTVNNTVYGAFADITQYVDSNETGDYSVANIVSVEGTGGGGNYGGWTILLIYSDPSASEPFKNVSVFNGFKYINDIDNDSNITISGFVTPDKGPVVSSIAYFAGDGDPADGGSAKTQYNNTGSYEPIYDDTNLMNSFSTILGAPGSKTYGIDADLVTVSKYIDNSQKSATFLFDAGIKDHHYNNSGVLVDQKDYYTLNMFAFSTDMYTPLIHDMNKTAKVNGAVINESTSIKVGDTLTYTIHFENKGSGEDALEVEIFDDFNQDDLNEVFDIDHFDATTIKLSEVNQTNVWQDTPNCGYNNSEHKVWCKIDKILDGESYDMRFDVAIIGQFVDDSNVIVDSNVTNTVYSIYKNATTGDYLELVQGDDGEWYGGSSNTYNAGSINPASGPVVSNAHVDVIDAALYVSNYAAANRSIYTKVVDKSFDLEMVYIDSEGNEANYDGSYRNNPLSLPVFMYLSDGDTCTVNEDLIWNGELAYGASHKTIHINGTIYGEDQGFKIVKAFKNKKIRTSILDFGTLLDQASGLRCGNSSLQSSLKLVPACFNNPANITATFPPTTFPNITTCIDGDGIAGHAAPCDQNAYDANGKKTTIYPLMYDKDLGCAMCIADALGNAECSTDNFSARPELFTISSSDGHMPELLRSGHDYSVELNAYNYNSSTNTQGYNQTKANLIMSDSNVTAADGSSTELFGTVAFAASSDFNMTNGISKFAGNTEVVDITFNDVGKVNLKVIDKNWAIIDNDDGMASEMTTVDFTQCNDDNNWICGDTDVRFIVDHFDINETNVTNNSGPDNNFTYIANLNPADTTTYGMGARIQVTLSAKNEDGAITKNFHSNPAFYENNVSLTSVANHAVHGNANITTIAANLLGFDKGVKTLKWDESNTSKVLRFNYPRTVNSPINPFEVNAANVSVTASSSYSQTTPAATVVITGTKAALEDGAAKFIYGRTHASRQRYDINPGTANIYNEVFCSNSIGTTCTISLIQINGISPSMQRTDDIRWYIVEGHTNTDGVVGDVDEKDSLGAVTSNTPVGNYPSVATLTYNNNDYPYKTTMENNASSWLIYDPDDATGNTTTINSFPVEFVEKDGGWSGKNGGVANVEDNTTNANTNRRSMW